MKSLNEICERLFKEKSVALFSHVRPDGDTLGSALALKAALKDKGIAAEVFCDDEIPDRFYYLKDAENIKREFSGEFTALVAIDCADIYRLGNFAEIFGGFENTYCIDHHISNAGYAKYSFVSERAANCENIYELINLAGARIEKETANCLLTGIITDTGGFKHKNVTKNTLVIAGDLVEKGADANEISFYNFTRQSKERAKLFGTVMQNIRYFLDGKLAVATAFKKDIDRIGAKQSETEGFVEFLMGIEGVEVGVCMLETEKGKFKISFRSKRADVSSVAAEFGGGGHTLASGCKIIGSHEEILDRLRFAVYKYLPES